ncbi:MAG: hypothetical protein JRJ87_24000 [Deltaproteobacteria bacterium]|nr:hypothetical protein [Deltaproteobacteria bacterium]
MRRIFFVCSVLFVFVIFSGCSSDSACTPNTAGEIAGNQIDDDCDGLTDEECESDAECDDNNDCTADSCADYSCEATQVSDQTACDDANPCTLGDVCLAGACTGSFKDCSDLDGDCFLGACDESSGDCLTVDKADGTGCNDGLFCTIDDECQNGVCTGVGTYDCDDFEPCTLDECNENTQDCDHTWELKPGQEGPPGSGNCSNSLDDDCDELTDDEDPNCRTCNDDIDCDDGNPCTVDECVNTSCQNTPKADDTPCDDGLYCTAADHCRAGRCISEARDCSDWSDACHTGGCSEADSSCVAEPKQDGTECEDGLYCTVADQCQGGVCIAGTDRDCDEGDFCTTDTCNDEFDRCEHVWEQQPGEEGPLDDPSCSNNQDDDCDTLTDMDDPDCSGCTENEDCDDLNPCTADLCDAGACSNPAVANDTPCDDGLYCTEPDLCSDGECNGTRRDCSELDDQCNTGVCDELNSQCVAHPKDAETPCNDGDDCTMNDMCDTGSCLGEPLDADSDGFVSDLCDGDDCDDGDPDVNPGENEGPVWDAECDDLADNDCDQDTDGDDIGCGDPFEVICSRDDWCFENPLPQGNHLYGAHGTDSDDIWAAGSYGTVLHFDGVLWSKRATNTTVVLQDVWAGTSNDAWIVGSEGTILHWDGQAIQGETSPTDENLMGVFGFSGDDVWAVGDNGIILHYNGSSWSGVTSPTDQQLRSVWGANLDDVWAVGASGVIIHWDGDEWSLEAAEELPMLRAVWGTAADDIWVVGNDGTIIRYFGGGWSSMANPMAPDLTGVSGSAADDVWVVGKSNRTFHWDGEQWEERASSPSRAMYAVWVAASDDVWIMGLAGTLRHWNGSNWYRLDHGSITEVYDVWSHTDGSAWAVGGDANGGEILQRLAGAWYPWRISPPEILKGIWGFSATDIWAVGEAGLIMQYTGDGWDTVTSNTEVSLQAVWGSATDDMWAVGSSGTVMRNSNGSWQSFANPADDQLRGVSGSGQQNVWVVGRGGTIMHWTGEQWSTIDCQTSEDLNDVWVIDDDNVYIVGNNGLVIHYDGQCRLLTPGTSENLKGVWGTATSELWIVGYSGTILFFNGSQWSGQNAGTGTALHDIHGVAGGTAIRAVGNYGTILVKSQ